MILGSSRKFKGAGYVCFIDVLGFSNDILKNWKDPAHDPLEKILTIKREMPGFSSVEDKDDSQSHRIYACRVNTISDSVTICFGYPDKVIVGDLVLGLEAVLSNASFVWSTFIQNGYTVRGAIDFGDIYWDETELIGPAFINAYRLESEVARISRIIVSSNLNKVLKDLLNKHKSSLTEHLMRSFRKDIDGYIIVDPSILYQSDSESSGLLDSLKKMRDIVPTEVLKAKYTPLISMLSEDDAKPVLRDEDVGEY
ncbi:MAG: hypothetical protein A4E62_02651 [Syntrophorhabdus sp. PtaU1.Bin002]|nr:MAG: hypothetical protein A4E62_02651 [Syntrophorhabdus sp. PtaU1.Bin002]